jgi:hypothetical protein
MEIFFLFYSFLLYTLASTLAVAFHSLSDVTLHFYLIPTSASSPLPHTILSITHNIHTHIRTPNSMSARKQADIAFHPNEPMTGDIEDYTIPDSPQPGSPMADNLESDDDEHVAPAPGELAQELVGLGSAIESAPLPTQASSQGVLHTLPLPVSATASEISVEIVVINADGDVMM